MTNHTINGAVTVERYINISGGGHAKAWEFLATPTKGQTVLQSWMENGSKISTGYGTQVTGAAGLGFDMTSPAPSMKYFDLSNATGWTGVASAGTQLYDSRGYMLFVRGDRSVDGVVNTTANPTTMRSTGTLLTATQTIPVAANVFASIGNPYAAALDMKKVMLAKAGGVNEFFTVWNSNLGGTYGYGAYQTFSLNPGNGNYESTPGPVTNNFIQSGQAFIVQTTGGAGNMVFNEHSKANASGGFITFFRPERPSGRAAQLRTNLYVVNADGSSTIADGTLQQFSDEYDNAIDGLDARKFYNSSENLSIRIAGKDLIIERRKFPVEQDTVFYNLASVKAGNYHFDFIASGLSAAGVERIRGRHLSENTHTA